MIKNYVDTAISAVQRFNFADYGVFKLCLICMGILIGIYATRTCRKNAAFIWLTFGVSYVYLMYRVYLYGGFEH